MITDWNSDFTRYDFPVDVFWMDIPHTADFKYFIYNVQRFSIDAVDEMNRQVEEANRTLVVITDP